MFDFNWFDDFDWLDIGLAGALGEEMADEEKNIKKIEKDFDTENSDEDENHI